jgi:hypothetical protein
MLLHPGRRPSPRTVGGAVVEQPSVLSTRVGQQRVPAPRPSPSSAARSQGETCLPAELERLLLDVVADGFTVYCCGPVVAPCALVAAYQWEYYVDLVTIRCFDQVITARIPAPRIGPVDVFAPESVVWAYEGPPWWALRALLNLVSPQHPHAPTTAYPAPTSLHIPRAEQRPMTIRLPSPAQAGRRAIRLADRDGN